MRTTVDIPDDLYRRLKTEAAVKGTSIKALILRSVLPTQQASSAASISSFRFLSARPKEDMTSVSVRIPVSMATRLEKICRDRKLEKSELIREAIEVCLGQVEMSGAEGSPEPSLPGRKLANGMVIPAIESQNPGSLKLGPEGVYEYIPFP